MDAQAKKADLAVTQLKGVPSNALSGDKLPSSRFRRARVFVDCNSFGPRAIEAATRLYGADRIVCGTDGTAFGVDWTLKAVAESDIGVDAREKILTGNAAALLAQRAAAAQRQKAAA